MGRLDATDMGWISQVTDIDARGWLLQLALVKTLLFRRTEKTQHLNCMVELVTEALFQCLVGSNRGAKVLCIQLTQGNLVKLLFGGQIGEFVAIVVASKQAAGGQQNGAAKQGCETGYNLVAGAC